MSPSRSLYFVMEQMEAYDEDEGQEGVTRPSRVTNDCSTYRHSWYVLFMRDFFILICTHIRSSATRIVHQLVDGSISIDRARVHPKDLRTLWFILFMKCPS